MPEKDQPGQQEAQQKLMLYQLLNQRIEQIKEHATIIEQKMLELEATGQALDDFKKLREGNEVLVPLGSGCYTYGKTGPGLLVDLGAGIMVKRSPEEAKEAIAEKKAEVERVSKALHNEAGSVVERMNKLGPELQELLQGSREQGGKKPQALG